MKRTLTDIRFSSSYKLCFQKVPHRTSQLPREFGAQLSHNHYSYFYVNSPYPQLPSFRPVIAHDSTDRISITHLYIAFSFTVPAQTTKTLNQPPFPNRKAPRVELVIQIDPDNSNELVKHLGSQAFFVQKPLKLDDVQAISVANKLNCEVTVIFLDRYHFQEFDARPERPIPQKIQARQRQSSTTASNSNQAIKTTKSDQTIRDSSPPRPPKPRTTHKPLRRPKQSK